MKTGGTNRSIYGFDADDMVLTPRGHRAVVLELKKVDGLMRAELQYALRPRETACLPAHLLTRMVPPRRGS